MVPSTLWFVFVGFLIIIIYYTSPASNFHFSVLSFFSWTKFLYTSPSIRGLFSLFYFWLSSGRLTINPRRVTGDPSSYLWTRYSFWRHSSPPSIPSFSLFMMKKFFKTPFLLFSFPSFYFQFSYKNSYPLWIRLPQSPSRVLEYQNFNLITTCFWYENFIAR